MWECHAELSADGAPASAETSGGGSGGSIFVEASYLEFYGFVHANGGAGGDIGGGGGGGGRIMFLLNNTVVQESSQFTGNYSAFGGRQGMAPSLSPSFLDLSDVQTISPYDGEDGTVWTSLAPCAVGRGSVFCTICPEGTYKNETDVSPCLPCTNGPPHSVYTNREQGNEDCPFTCISGYRGKDCLTPFAEFLRQIGGWMMVIIVLSLFVIVLVACMLFILKYNRPFARMA